MGTVAPKIGDFGLVRTPDIGGRIIRLGTDSFMNHAFIYVGETDKGNIIEARPGGAGFNYLENYSKPNYRLTWSTDLFDLSDAQRTNIRQEALMCRGVGYNWIDIVALSLNCLKVKTPYWAVRVIENDHRLVCSQLVDKVYLESGIHLFNDGRYPGAVTPGDLWNLVLDKENARVS